jgi:protein gp37
MSNSIHNQESIKNQPASKTSGITPDGDMSKGQNTPRKRQKLDWDAMNPASYPAGYTNNDRRGFRRVLTWLEKNRSEDPPQEIRQSKHFEPAKAYCQAQREAVNQSVQAFLHAPRVSSPGQDTTGSDKPATDESHLDPQASQGDAMAPAATPELSELSELSELPELPDTPVTAKGKKARGKPDVAGGKKKGKTAPTPPKPGNPTTGKAKQVVCVDVGEPALSGLVAEDYILSDGALGDTEISWTHRTLNFWMGCVKVSDGCRECYAEDQCIQYGRHLWGANAPRLPVASAAAEARACNRAAGEKGCKDTVFCSSLSDFFEDRKDLVELRAEAWKVIKECKNLVFIILTKRPENIAGMLPPDWGDNGYLNVCLATTVENGTERVMNRIGELRAVPARWRMLSVEPLLGPVDLRGRLDDINWVIVGGESGKTADPMVIRPMHPDWAMAIRDACQEANVAFFFKQWGSWSMPKPAGIENPAVVEWQGLTLYFTGLNRNNMAPALLNGRLWREHPFGPDVDLDRLSAHSRIQTERAAARNIVRRDPESRAEFERLHQVVLTGFQAAFEAGRALADIRERKLWRAGEYQTWQDYCDTLGDISRPYADRLIKSSEIHAGLVDTAPIGADGQPVLPLNESQVRPLARLPDAVTRNVAWHRAVSQSNGKVPTARVVNAAVVEVLATHAGPPQDSSPGEGHAPPSGEGETADSQGKSMVVHTIGFTGKSAAQFFTLLRENKVRRVIDVRHSNNNQLAGFTKREDLEFFLREILGIDYHWLQDLALTEEIRNIHQTGDMEAYKQAFLELMGERDVESRVDPNLINGSCLLGSEHEPDHCHRLLVAEYLKDRWSGRNINLEITHLK